MSNPAQVHAYKPAIAQPMHTFIARGFDHEFVLFAGRHNVSIVAYNPLAGGLLTGKHSASKIIPETRFDGNRMYQDRYRHTQNFEAAVAPAEIAAKAGGSLVSLAFAWLLQPPEVDGVALGASRLENLAACEEGPIAPELLRECDEVWRRLCGPFPAYNR